MLPRAALYKTLSLATALALAAAIVVSTLAAELARARARSLTEVARRMADGDLTTPRAPNRRRRVRRARACARQLAKNLSRTLGDLSEERDRLGGILASMQEGVLLLDRSGHIYVLNPSLREMLLVGPDSVGKTVLEVVRHAELKELLDLGASLSGSRDARNRLRHDSAAALAGARGSAAWRSRRAAGGVRGRHRGASPRIAAP